MAQFNDVLNLFGDDIPEEIAGKLISAYDEDMTIPAAKVNELEGALSERDQKIADLKGQNYDLIRTGAGAGSDPTPKPDPSDFGDVKRITHDDLFQ